MRAVCIDARPADGLQAPPLEEGAVYGVNAVVSCSCGKVLLDVGLPVSDRLDVFICRYCDSQMLGREMESWLCYSHRFKPVDPLSEALDRIEVDALRLLRHTTKHKYTHALVPVDLAGRVAGNGRAPDLGTLFPAGLQGPLRQHGRMRGGDRRAGPGLAAGRSGAAGLRDLVRLVTNEA